MLNVALLLLTAASPAAPSTPDLGIVTQEDAAPEDSFDALVREYESAYETWREEYREADRDQKNELRDVHPTVVFWPRFEELGQGGEGRALLWQLENLRRSGLSRREQEQYAPVSLWVPLVNQHREAKWFREVIELMGRTARKDGDVLMLLELVAKDTDDDDNRGMANLTLGDLLLSSGDEEERARGEAILEQVKLDFEGSQWADAAHVRLMAERLSPGNPAPDFTGKTIDGYEFALSDYEGKVVLLDFYGFW